MSKTSYLHGKATWVTYKLGGMESLGISKVGQIVLARLM